MKNILYILTFTALLIAGSTTTLSAQKLVVGERIPDINAKRWLSGTPSTDGKNIFIEFYHSANRKSNERLARLNDLALANSSTLTVIVISREDDANAEAALTAGSPAYYTVIDDDSKTFSLFGVQYIPYSILCDKRGRILWLGNPSSTSNSEIIGYIN